MRNSGGQTAKSPISVELDAHRLHDWYNLLSFTYPIMLTDYEPYFYSYHYQLPERCGATTAIETGAILGTSL